jgi:hypothetical protein
MAVTRTHANNVIIKWRKQFFREYRRGNLFAPYMGESPTSIIQVLRDLADGGDQVNIPIITGMRGPGVSTGPLVGNEERLDTYGMRAWIDWARNAVLLTRAELRRSAIDQLETVRPLLTEWAQVLLRDEIILALHALPSTTPPTGFAMNPWAALASTAFCTRRRQRRTKGHLAYGQHRPRALRRRDLQLCRGQSRLVVAQRR